MEIKRIATRESYGNALKLLGQEHQNIVVLDADLAGATRTSRFKQVYPNRFIDCGIAEENMMSVAAGLSTMGLVPFVSSFAMFASGRAWEQVRNSIGYPHLNVKIAATHGGVSVGEDGATHQCNEDFALMRVIPGMTVMCASDDVEARKMVEAAYYHKGPVYMRFGRAYAPVFHSENMEFEIGKGEMLKEGNDVAIIANGILVYEALKAAELLEKENVSAMVVNFATIKPLDEELLIRVAKQCSRIIIAEEHSIIGGLGETVSTFFAENCPVKVKRIGVRDIYGHSGSCDELLLEFGLSCSNIVKAVRSIIDEY